jgi:hypothetical protein
VTVEAVTATEVLQVSVLTKKEKEAVESIIRVTSYVTGEKELIQGFNYNVAFGAKEAGPASLRSSFAASQY